MPLKFLLPPSFLFCFVPYFDGPTFSHKWRSVGPFATWVLHASVQVQDTPKTRIPSVASSRFFPSRFMA